ncbi:MAG: FAD:protein FMN transferase [Atopobiaceae bacterium]|jgi:thiamine biosynthesis lipoprotein
MQKDPRQMMLSRRAFAHGLVGCVKAAALVALPALVGCDASFLKPGATESETMLTKTFFAFDTVVDLQVYCTQDMMDELHERCRYLERIFSRTIEGSDIWNINHAQGAEVEVASETADIIVQSLEYAEKSQGLFDITIGTVSSLWDFKEGIKPADEEIQAALPHVGYENIEVSGCTVRLKDPETKLDLGGIAKGYIADNLTQLLVSYGVERGVINLGGNVSVLGTKEDGSDWNVGVQDPNKKNQVIALISCHDNSVVTSGLYERKFEQDGELYYHILDPTTGYPVKTDLVSSSVSYKNALDADVVATVLFLLGKERALSFVDQHKDFDVLLCGADGTCATGNDTQFEVFK